ncbi:MAG: helix-turn-helix domain-containing protein [Tannerella sp.]|nr:helix-turn-helix domain-containing protein [Tannerella sp.]
MSSRILSNMLFAEKIRQLREEKQLLQRQISAALEIDNALYCKIERGDRQAKKIYIPVIAKILQVDPEDLLALWLADQVVAIMKEDKDMSDKVLSIAKQNIKNQ